MNLHVEFMGLCLFVPQSDAVHVLMPRTGEMTGGYYVNPHHVTLQYTGTGGVTRVVDMPGWCVDLSGARGTEKEAALSTALIESGRLSGKRVDSRQWSDRPRRTVVSRITLPPASDIDYRELVEWEVDLLTGIKEAAYLTHHLTWKITNAAVQNIVWERKRLDNAKPECEVLDTPMPIGNRIELKIAHVPAKERMPSKWEEATHYQAYRNVFGDRGRHHKIFLAEDPFRAAFLGASAFTCMLAVAPPE